MTAEKELTAAERARYEWQMWVPDFGELGQRKLKGASVLVSRCGGLGGLVAYQLAAAGIGKLVLAHGGSAQSSDLHRQLLITDEWVGKPRMESIARRLRELNPLVELEAVPHHVDAENVAGLVGAADVVVDCAPRFEERFLMNAEAVRQRKPMVEAAVFELQAQLTTISPGNTPCLACIYPERPPAWRRQFPVFGAVSGSLGCMAAMEAIKLITGIGEPLFGRLLTYHLGSMEFRKLRIRRNPACAVCGAA